MLSLISANRSLPLSVKCYRILELTMLIYLQISAILPDLWLDQHLSVPTFLQLRL